MTLTTPPVLPPEALSPREQHLAPAELWMTGAKYASVFVVTGVLLVALLAILAGFAMDGTVLAVPDQPVRWNQLDLTVTGLTIHDAPRNVAHRQLIACYDIGLRNRTAEGQPMPAATDFSVWDHGQALAPADYLPPSHFAYPNDPMLGPDDELYTLCFWMPPTTVPEQMTLKLHRPRTALVHAPTILWRFSSWRSHSATDGISFVRPIGG
jgi:hypothetical protein